MITLLVFWISCEYDENLIDNGWLVSWVLDLVGMVCTTIILYHIL